MLQKQGKPMLRPMTGNFLRSYRDIQIYSTRMAWQDGTPFPFSISSPGAAYAQREEVECGTIPYI